jgi:hypothetical protein
MNKRSLDALVPHLQQALGAYWRIKTYTTAECRETMEYDPPCAYLEAKCAIGGFNVVAGGEVYDLSGDFAFTFISATPWDRTVEITRWLAEFVEQEG